MYIQPGLAAAADGQKEQKKEKVDSLGGHRCEKKNRWFGSGSAPDPRGEISVRCGKKSEYDGMKPEISYQ